MSNSSRANTQYTKTLGSIAFAEGKARVPGADSKLTEYMGGRQIGDKRSMPELKAWLVGWDEANLAA